jgi:hypothetical protein
MRMPIVGVVTLPARRRGTPGARFPMSAAGKTYVLTLTWREHTEMIAASNAETTWSRTMPPGSSSVSRPSDSD